MKRTAWCMRINLRRAGRIDTKRNILRELTILRESGRVMCSRRHNRKGSVLVLSAFLMVILLGILAFALDLGYVYVSQAQLQRSADAAALAAAYELIDQSAVSGDGAPVVSPDAVRSAAAEYAAYNYVLAANPGLATDDVTLGYIENPFADDWVMQTNNINMYNAVTVRVRRDEGQNGTVPLFFARFLGHDHVSLQASATAAVLVNVRGFSTPKGGMNQGIMPFALDEETWNNMLDGGGDDDWCWDAENEEIVSGADGVREMNLYPQGTGAPGNRGTVDIGSSNNSTADIARQITDGATPEDLAYHGGSLALDENGLLYLNGDTGISAGVKDELESIKGEPRIIPIFRTVVGPGNNATYTIVAFAGVRIMEVKLTGNMNSKRVIIQPANMVAPAGIPGSDTARTSYFVYSPVWLVK